MITDILSKFNIDSFGFISADLCSEKNSRLFRSVPEGCNAIFILFPYYTENAPRGISRYAAVYDYHSFAKVVFCRLLQYIEEQYPGSYACGFSDHSPYLESEGAAMAGLGIIGDHSLLISKKYSSFVFIGELVTDLSREILLSEGIPEGDGKIKRCHGCKSCSRACPAECRDTKDLTLCASAVSQKKGELSEKEKEILIKSNSIWGCDICQTACPYTKKALNEGTLYTPIPFFSDSVLKGSPEDAVLKMDSEEFEQYPFSWRKREVIERNIKIIRSGDLHNG